MEHRSNNPIAEAVAAGALDALDALDHIGRGEGKAMLARVDAPVHQAIAAAKAPNPLDAAWGIQDEAQLSALIGRSRPMSSPSLREDVNIRLEARAQDISQVAAAIAAELIHHGSFDQEALRSGLSGDGLAQETFAFQFAASISNEAAKSLSESGARSLSGSEPELARFAQGAFELPQETRAFAIDYFKAQLATHIAEISEPEGRRRVLGASGRQALANALSAAANDPALAREAAAIAIQGPKPAKVRSAKMA